MNGIVRAATIGAGTAAAVVAGGGFVVGCSAGTTAGTTPKHDHVVRDSLLGGLVAVGVGAGIAAFGPVLLTSRLAEDLGAVVAVAGATSMTFGVGTYIGRSQLDGTWSPDDT